MQIAAYGLWWSHVVLKLGNLWFILHILPTAQMTSINIKPCPWIVIFYILTLLYYHMELNLLQNWDIFSRHCIRNSKVIIDNIDNGLWSDNHYLSANHKSNCIKQENLPTKKTHICNTKLSSINVGTKHA